MFRLFLRTLVWLVIVGGESMPVVKMPVCLSLISRCHKVCRLLLPDL